jgi:predicted N-acetyltransferase YhbS
MIKLDGQIVTIPELARAIDDSADYGGAALFAFVSDIDEGEDVVDWLRDRYAIDSAVAITPRAVCEAVRRYARLVLIVDSELGSADHGKANLALAEHIAPATREAPRIRNATIRDAAAIFPMTMELLRLADPGREFHAADVRDGVLTTLRNPVSDVYLVAEMKEADLVVGQILVSRCGHDEASGSGQNFMLRRLFVLETYRRRGVGRALVRAALSMAENSAAGDILACVLDSAENTAPAAVFESEGLKVSGVVYRMRLRQGAKWSEAA